MYWQLILIVDLLLAFGPAIIIIFSKKAKGKMKMKWVFYSIASVTLAPVLLIALLTVVFSIAFGENGAGFTFIAASIATPVISLFAGWFVLYLFFKKHKVTNPKAIQSN